MKKKKTTKKTTTNTKVTVVDTDTIDRVFVALLGAAEQRAYLDISVAKKFGVDDGDDYDWMFEDSKDLVNLARLIQHGNLSDIKKAYKKAQDLDTAVRDDVPEVFWELAEMVGVK